MTTVWSRPSTPRLRLGPASVPPRSRSGAVPCEAAVSGPVDWTPSGARSRREVISEVGIAWRTRTLAGARRRRRWHPRSAQRERAGVLPVPLCGGELVGTKNGTGGVRVMDILMMEESKKTAIDELWEDSGRISGD